MQASRRKKRGTGSNLLNKRTRIMQKALLLSTKQITRKTCNEKQWHPNSPSQKFFATTNKLYIFKNCDARPECPFLFPVSRHIFGGQFGSRYPEKSNDKRVMQHEQVWHCCSLFRIIHSGTESWAASSESSFFLVAMERRESRFLFFAATRPAIHYIPTLLTCN